MTTSKETSLGEFWSSIKQEIKKRKGKTPSTE
jgi:hypothetical protein